MIADEHEHNYQMNLRVCRVKSDRHFETVLLFPNSAQFLSIEKNMHTAFLIVR